MALSLSFETKICKCMSGVDRSSWNHYFPMERLDDVATLDRVRQINGNDEELKKMCFKWSKEGKNNVCELMYGKDDVFGKEYLDNSDKKKLEGAKFSGMGCNLKGWDMKLQDFMFNVFVMLKKKKTLVKSTYSLKTF